jgi:hypothetical protein
MNLGKLSAYLKILGYQPGGSGTTLPPATDTVDGYLTAADHVALSKARNDFSIAGLAQSITTSATPTAGTFVAFAAQACNALVIKAGNVALQFQRNGAGAALDIEPNERKVILGITNASQIGLRRRDYAECATNQVTAVVAQPINTGLTYSVSHQVLVGNANATPLVLTAAACTAVFIRNTSFKMVEYSVNDATAYQTLRRSESVLIPGITNANQIKFRPFDSQSASGLQVEVFNGIYPEVSSNLPLIERLSSRAVVLPDQLSGVYPNFPNLQLGAGIPQFQSFIRWNCAGRTLVTADYLANAFMSLVSGSLASVALTDVLPSEAAPQWEAIGNTFSADATPLRRALRATWSGTATVLVTSSKGIQPAGISVVDKYIFSRIKLVSGTAGNLKLRLYSSGSPSAPGAGYHEMYMGDNQSDRGYARLHGHNHRSVWANDFVAVNGGADLTSIKFTAWEVAGTSGTVVQFEEMRVVKPAFPCAHMWLNGDDTKPSFARGVRELLQIYGFPSTFFFSPLATTLSVNRSITEQDALRMQREGSQIGMQDFRGDTGTNNNIFEQQMMVNENMLVAAIAGFDTEGMRDASLYGGGIANGSDIQVYHNDPHWIATKRRYDTPNTATTGKVFPRVDTLPPGDPYDMISLGASTFTTVLPTAAANAERWKAYTMQCQAVKGVGQITWHDEGESAIILGALAEYLPWLRAEQDAGRILVTTPVVSRRMFAALSNA